MLTKFFVMWFVVAACGFLEFYHARYHRGEPRGRVIMDALGWVFVSGLMTGSIFLMLIGVLHLAGKA